MKGMKKLWMLGLISLMATTAISEESYAYRIYLKEKGDAGYALDQPEKFLSKEALQRRAHEGIAVDSTDLPISPSVIERIAQMGFRPVTQSRWFATVVVMTDDSTKINRLNGLDEIDSVKWIWQGDDALPEEEMPFARKEKIATPDPITKSYYGYAEKQTTMIDGERLHHAGYKGEGMTIAIFDAGFRNVDRLMVFDSLKLKGTRNFVFPQLTVFRADDHGTKALSCLAANAPGIMVGTAPEASYWLIKSEDSRSEYPIEEDYWTAAAEFADSVGVDLISSSLGYYKYDDDRLSPTQNDLDGKSAFITRAAEMAAKKGMLVISSAGNEGHGDWNKITFPGDAGDILTVAAVDEKKKPSTFSSEGFIKRYATKPDVTALGTDCTVIDPSGIIRLANGTSFSTPTVAGMAACLKQALPSLTVPQLIRLIQQSSSRYKHPDRAVGYGIPDFYKAYQNGLKDEKRNDRY